jgi:DNA-3-methyladenine glycosylase II
MRAIVSQQLSTHAAQSILQRIESRYGLDARKLSRARVRTLRSLGLSETKAHTLRRVAKMSAAGELDDLDAMSDDAVAERLTAIKGIGPWTCHMVMIFSLGRPDVWPVGDAGIQRAARTLYKATDAAKLERLGERFRPFRSHAAWYLWRSLEGG